MRNAVSLPNPGIVIDLMALVVLGTSALATSVLWSHVDTDNWYLGHLNGFIAGLMVLLSLHRIYLGVERPSARRGWMAIAVLFSLLAVMPFLNIPLETMLDDAGLDDLDDLALLLVLPVALAAAVRSEPMHRLPLQLLIGGFVVQCAATFLDLADDQIEAIGHVSIGELVDFAAFIYLQLYFVGLTLTMVSLYLQRRMQGAPSGRGLLDSMNGAVSGYRSITAQLSRRILAGQCVRSWIIGLVVITGLGFVAAYAENEYREHQAIVALQRGNQMVYLRHADRFAGPKESLSAASTPREYLDCSAQRNLTPKGRKQAAELGRQWRALNIPVGKVYANAQCRTRETAELAFGKAEVDPRIFDVGFVRALLLQTPTDGTNTIVVGNDYQLHELTGLELGKGEAALIAPDGRGGIKVVTILELDDWPDALASGRK